MKFHKVIAMFVLTILVLPAYAVNKGQYSDLKTWTRGTDTYVVQKITDGVKIKNPSSIDIKRIYDNETEEDILSIDFEDNAILSGVNIDAPIEYPSEDSIWVCDIQTEKIETLKDVVEKIAPEEMTEHGKMFLLEEVKFLNLDKMNIDGSFTEGEELEVPIYKKTNDSRLVCCDSRNYLVAVMKSKKYGVHWGVLLGVRTQENPYRRGASRAHVDGYALGVVAKKGTDIWTQYDWGAKILKRYLRNPMNPSYDTLYRCARTYVGMYDSEHKKWARNVYSVYQKCSR